MALGAFASGLAGGLERGVARRDRQEYLDRLDAALDQRSPQAPIDVPGMQSRRGMGAARSTLPPASDLTDDARAGRGAARTADDRSGVIGASDTTDDARAGRGAGRVEGDRGPAPTQEVSAPGGSVFLGLMDKYEGGGDYSTLFGHSQRDGGRFAGVDVSNMTVDEVIAFTNPRGEYGQWVKSELGRSGKRARIATPTGRFQIVGRTLRGAKGAMGLDGSTRYDRNTQNRIATHLAQQRLASARTPAGKRRAMRAEWEGLQHVPDRELDAAIRELEDQI